MKLIYESELYHHGVKGMKWGVRKKYEPTGDRRSSKKQEDDIDKKKRGLSSKQKTAIKIGAAAVATAIVAYGTYRLAKSGKLNKLADAGREKVRSIFGVKKSQSTKVTGLSLDNFKKLSHKESIDETLSKVNPSKQRNNCYNCVVATVGRLCGLDITAKGDTQGGKGMRFDDLCKAMGLNPDNETQVRRIMSPSVDKISSVISKRYKEGDCGAIGLSWNDTYKKATGVSEAGHTLNWILKNGKVEFMDGQVGISGDRLKNLMSNLIDSGKEASIARFANVDDGLSIASDILSKFAN